MRRLLVSLPLSLLLISALVAGCDDSEGAPADATTGADATAPAADTTAPAEDTTAPAEDTAAPAADTVTPAEDTVTPAEDTVTPAEDTVTPAEDTAAPTDTEPPSAGACDNPTDQGTLAAQADTIADKMTACAFECIATGETCATACVEREVGLTSACSACFGTVLSCTLSNCAFQCFDASSAGCKTCRDTNCTPAFETCAGISEP